MPHPPRSAVLAIDGSGRRRVAYTRSTRGGSGDPGLAPPDRGAPSSAGRRRLSGRTGEDVVPADETVPGRPGPLGHVRVLDLSRLYPGAFCTGLLADLGADVVKVEAPGAGDGLRFVETGEVLAAHLALNRGKRSIRIDLKHEEAA